MRVVVLAVVCGVALPLVPQSLGHLACGNAVAVYFKPEVVLLFGSAALCALVNDYARKIHILRGGKALPVALSGNPSVASGFVESYKALVALAAQTKDGKTALLVINRDPGREVTAKLSVPGVELPAAIQASVLNGPSICAFNSPAHPDEVNVKSVELPVKDGCVTFPAHSIVTLVLQRRIGGDPQ